MSFESQQFFKRIFYLKQTNVITGTPWSGGPGAIAPVAPLNPALNVPLARIVHGAVVLTKCCQVFISFEKMRKQAIIFIFTCLA